MTCIEQNQALSETNANTVESKTYADICSLITVYV